MFAVVTGSGGCCALGGGLEFEGEDGRLPCWGVTPAPVGRLTRR